jgi:hypothetical protein
MQHKRSTRVDREGVKILLRRPFATYSCIIKFYFYFHRYSYFCCECVNVFCFLLIRYRIGNAMSFVMRVANARRALTLAEHKNTTLCGGSLGSRVDEERSKLRELM